MITKRKVYFCQYGYVFSVPLHVAAQIARDKTYQLNEQGRQLKRPCSQGLYCDHYRPLDWETDDDWYGLRADLGVEI
jgi:hypothetical protein